MCIPVLKNILTINRSRRAYILKSLKSKISFTLDMILREKEEHKKRKSRIGKVLKKRVTPK